MGVVCPTKVVWDVPIDLPLLYEKTQTRKILSSFVFLRLFIFSLSLFILTFSSPFFFLFFHVWNLHTCLPIHTDHADFYFPTYNNIKKIWYILQLTLSCLQRKNDTYAFMFNMSDIHVGIRGKDAYVVKKKKKKKRPQNVNIIYLCFFTSSAKTPGIFMLFFTFIF